MEASKELPYVPITAIDSPKWGGKCKIHNKHITLTNTCPLDNMLYILVTLFDNKNIENFSHYKIIELLNEMLEYSGDWDSVKAIWLIRTQPFHFTRSVTQPVWNIYGSEHNVVNDHLGELMHYTRLSECTNEQCSWKEFYYNNNTIDVQ